MHPRYFIVPSPTCRHLWLSCQADIHGTGRHTGIHARLASYSTVLYGVYCTSSYRTDLSWDFNRSNGRLSCPIQLDGRVVVPSTLVYDNPSSPSRRTLYRVACETFNCIGGNGPERLSALPELSSMIRIGTRNQGQSCQVVSNGSVVKSSLPEGRAPEQPYDDTT